MKKLRFMQLFVLFISLMGANSFAAELGKISRPSTSQKATASEPSQMKAERTTAQKAILLHNQNMAETVVDRDAWAYFACFHPTHPTRQRQVKEPLCVTIGELSEAFPHRAIPIADIIRTLAKDKAGNFTTRLTDADFSDMFPGSNVLAGCGGQGLGHGIVSLAREPQTQKLSMSDVPAKVLGKVDAPSTSRLGRPELSRGKGRSLGDVVKGVGVPGCGTLSHNKLSDSMGSVYAADWDTAEFTTTFDATINRCIAEHRDNGNVPTPPPVTAETGEMTTKYLFGKTAENPPPPPPPPPPKEDPPPPPPSDPPPPADLNTAKDSVKVTVGKIWAKIQKALGTDPTNAPKYGKIGGGSRGECADLISGCDVEQRCVTRAAAIALSDLRAYYNDVRCEANVMPNPDGPPPACATVRKAGEFTMQDVKQVFDEWCEKIKPPVGTMGVVIAGASTCRFPDKQEEKHYIEALKEGPCKGKDPRAMCNPDQGATGLRVEHRRTGFRTGATGTLPIHGPVPDIEELNY